MHLQDFLKVFERLRDELVNDELLGDQPEFGKKWMEEVSPRGEGGGARGRLYEGALIQSWLIHS